MAEIHGSETILVVDDEKVVRDFCTQVLTDAGYNVLSAEDGLVALQICRVAKGPVHLALLDVRMPRMSGHELLIELLDCLIPVNLGIKFVLMSGYADPDSGDTTRYSDRRYLFLEKPFTSSVLLKTVRRGLES